MPVWSSTVLGLIPLGQELAELEKRLRRRMLIPLLFKRVGKYGVADDGVFRVFFQELNPSPHCSERKCSRNREECCPQNSITDISTDSLLPLLSSCSHLA